nr:hypothetical protein [Tanacetum cinerariifolium]
MDTGASSHLMDNTGMLTSFINSSIYPSVFVGNDHSIPVTITRHSFLLTYSKPLQLNHILVTPHIIKNLIYVRKLTRDNDLSVEFDAYGFLEPSFQTPVVLLSFSSTTWHRRLGHPGENVLHRLESHKSKLSALCHACQLALLQRIIALLHNKFAMTDLGSLNYFLGIFAQRSVSGMFLSQSKFADEILERAHMQNCNPCRTPVCLYMHDPRESPFAALKRILRYVRCTLDYGLQLHVLSNAQLTAYTDVEWVGCRVTRRSTFGYCVFLDDNLLSWSAKRQVTLSRSSAEVEYRAILVYCDNVSAVYMSVNPVQHQRTKHIEIDIYFVRDYVAFGQVRVLHVPSRFQYADIFTNGLPSALFLEFRSSLSLLPILMLNWLVALLPNGPLPGIAYFSVITFYRGLPSGRLLCRALVMKLNIVVLLM